MDYLDPRKDIKERVTLLVGYVLVAVAIAFASLVLLYQAYGFTFGKNGAVIQNGLLFFSSQPSPASIYINSKLSSYTTNTRLFLPSGTYQVSLYKSGYRSWQRRITVDGGSVEHFDYPMLIPDKLTSTKISTYASVPGLMSESPSKQYLLIQDPGGLTNFDLYNLSTPNKPVLTSLTLPNGLLSASTTGNQNLQLVAWSDDNQHVLVQHNYDGKTEYILLNINNISQSLNLNSTFDVTPTMMTLNNDKYNNYYIYDSAAETLESASLNNPSVLTPVATDVLSYQSYGNNEVLYTTPMGAKAGKVLVKLKTPSQTYNITSLQSGTNYLLNLTTYNGTLYVAVGSTSGSYVYIYQDPIGTLQNNPGQLLAPSWVLHVDQPDYLSFSNNAQFIMTENGDNYAVYDIENSLGYLYTDKAKALDAPQLHATWMDGDRLVYVSGGKVQIQDYDNNNQQTLVAASSSFIPAFSSNYYYMYTLDPAQNGQYNLAYTPLLIPSDL